MASGWGCWYQINQKDIADWCRLLSHPYKVGCKG